MSYLKGKDIKIPFDCLWHCYTRSFKAETFSKGYIPVDKYNRPEEFEQHEVQDLQ